MTNPTPPPPPGTLLGAVTDAMAPPNPMAAPAAAEQPARPSHPIAPATSTVGDRERAALRALAETEPDRAIAISALLLGHAEVREPSRMQWTCSCAFEPRVGELHAKHVAGEILRLLHRRRWLAVG